MPIINSDKGNLSLLADAATAGEGIISAKVGNPVVRLLPLENPAFGQPGIAKGRVTDAFFEPLPEQDISAWEA